MADAPDYLKRLIMPVGTYPEDQRKAAAKQILLKEQPLQAPPVEEYTSPAPLQEAPPALPTAPEKSSEAAFLRAEGRKRAEDQATFLAYASRSAGIDPELLFTRAQQAARKKDSSMLSADMFEVLNIDAMQRFGVKYKNPKELLQNYAADEATSAKEVEELKQVRVTMPPNVTMHAVSADDGKEMSQTPGWVGEVDPHTEAGRSKYRAKAGGTAAAAVGMSILPDEVQKSLAGGASSEKAKELGFDRAAKVIVNPFGLDGGGKLKNVRVYYTKSPEGTTGLDIRAYEESFILWHLDRMLRAEAGHTVMSAPRELVERIRAKAEMAAKEDIARMFHRNMALGNIVVDVDPEETTKRILKGDMPLMGAITPANLLRTLGATEAADDLARAQAPFVAMFHPEVMMTPSGKVSYGQTVMDVQKEHPMHWFLRAGAWTPLLSWYFNDDEWGSEQHLQRIRQGDDFTQYSRQLGERTAKFFGQEGNRRLEMALGIGGTIGLALSELDAPSILTFGVGKAGMAVGKAAKTMAVTGIAADYAKALRALETAGDAAAEVEITKILRSTDPNNKPFKAAYLLKVAQYKGREATIKTEEAVAKKVVGAEDAVKKADTDVVDSEEALRLAWQDQHDKQAAIQKLMGDASANAALERAKLTAQLAQAEKAAEVSEAKMLLAVKETQDDIKQLRAKLKRMARNKKKTTDPAVVKEIATAEARLVSLEKILQGKKISPKGMSLLDAQKYMSVQVIADDFIKARRYLPKVQAALAGADKTEQALLLRLQAKLNAMPAKTKKVELAEGGVEAAKKTATTKGGTAAKLLAEHDKAVQAVAAAQRAHLANVQPKLSQEQYHVIFGKQAAQEIADGLEKFIKMRQAGLPTQVDHLAELTWKTSVVSELGARASADEVVALLTRRYGNLGGLENSDVLRRLGTGKELTTQDMTDLFRFEKTVRNRVFVKDTLGEAKFGAALERSLFDPNFPGSITSHLGWNRATLTASAFKELERLKQFFSPSSQQFGRIGEGARDTGRRMEERLVGYQVEVAHIIKLSITDVEDYLTSAKVFQFGNTGTALNADTITIFAKWKNHVRGMVAAELPEKAFDGVARMFLPFGEKATPENMQVIIHALKQALADAGLDAKSDFNQLQFIKDYVANATKSQFTGKADIDRRATRDLIGSLILGAAQYDMARDVVRSFGVLDVQHARGMNMLMQGKAGGEAGALDLIDLEKGWEALELLGQSYASDKIGASISALKQEMTSVYTYAASHPDSLVPQQIASHLEGLIGKTLKELDEYHNLEHPVNTWLGRADYVLRLWKRSVVMGIALPLPKHFTNTFFGDFSQLVQSRGWLPAARIVGSTAVTYVPVVGRRLYIGLSDFAGHLPGDTLDLFVNPHMGAVMRRDARVVVKTGEGPRTALTFYQEAIEDGVKDFILGDAIRTATARRTAGWVGIAESGMNKWSGHWTGMMEEIQTRHRMAVYMEDRLNKGMTRRQARKRMMETFYDWKHGATDAEMATIGKVSAFYMFWRNAFNQLGHSVAEPLVTPGGNYLARAMIGRTKLARARQQGVIAMAVPEWWYWDDPDAMLNDAEQLEAWQKRQTPWWLGAKPWLYNVKVDPETQQWYRENRGINPDHETIVFPFLTALDTLSSLALLAQAAAAFSTGHEFSADAMELGEKELISKLAPFFEGAATATLDWAHNREAYRGGKGSPLRAGEEELLRFIGLLDLVTEADDTEGLGRRYITGPMQNVLSTVFRTTAVIGTELPAYISAVNNPAQVQGAKAQAIYMLRSLAGFGKPAPVDSTKQHSRKVKEREAMLEDRDKNLKDRSLPRPNYTE